MVNNNSTSVFKCVPHQLSECRFFPLKYQSKQPDTKGHLDESDLYNLDINDRFIVNHVRRGRGYGVVLRGNVYAIDCDAEELYELIPDDWRPTFSVETGRASGDGKHVFLRCSDGVKGVKIIFGEIGDMRTPYHRSYLVGPGSIHPDSGRPYVVLNDSPIINVTWQELSRFIETASGVVEEEEEQKETVKKIRRSTNSQSLSSQYNLKPEDWLYPDNAHRVGDTIIGGHPIHGSVGGRSLHIDTSRGLWRCFKHDSGGDGAIAYAVAKGIIDCSQARAGCLQDAAIMHKVLSALEDDGIKPIFEIDHTAFINRVLARQKMQQERAK